MRALATLSLLLALVPCAGLAAETALVDLHDSMRHREVPVTIRYPKGKSPCPLILFSHGLGGSRESYAYLGEAWAEHGYVVIHPTHAGSDSAVFKPGHPLQNLRNFREAPHDPDNLVNRPLDIRFVLDSLDTIEQKVPALRGRIDRVAIGMGGHSFGAYTALALAGAKIRIPGKDKIALSDPRIKAYIAMSPQGPAKMGFQSDSWGEIHAPLLLMTGSKDKGMGTGELPSWRLTAYASLPPGDKYSVYIEGVTHFSFAGLRRVSQDSVRFQGYIVRLSLAFWDAYLKKDSAAKALLTQDLLGKESKGEVRVESK